MSVRVIDVDNSQVVRVRVDRATACFYPGNKNRVVVVADGADFEAAKAALAELADHCLAEVCSRAEDEVDDLMQRGE